ncbi:MAG TPA: hypothetical protein VLL48_09225, partial [Longimicrobiales bacterium]|nr:hypothetical protein [Longimicrobiales bacterium]
VVLGLTLLILSSRWFIGAAIDIAREIGVSEMVIGLTIVAAGTSLPELVTSIVAAVRRSTDIAVGNIIGSNIFNVAAVLGAASTLGTIRVAPHVLVVELPAVLLLSALIIVVTLSGLTIRRWEGILLLASYGGLCAWVFL